MPHIPGHLSDTPNPLLRASAANPYADFLDLAPESAFFSTPTFQQATPNLRNFLQTGFRDFHNEFLGALGSQIRGGNLPTLRFPDFLQDVPFQQRFQESRFGPRSQTAQFNPRTRSIFGF